MDFEKKTVVEDTHSLPVTTPEEGSVEGVGDEEIYIDPKEEAKLLRKCDMYLVPLLTISFLSAYLDRSNIGNAAIAGLLPDLGMSSAQLANAVTLFYATYVCQRS